MAWLLHCRYIMLHGCITFYHGRLHSINHGCRFIEIIPFCDSPGPMQKGPSCQPGVPGTYWYSFTPHDPRVGNMFVTVLVPSCYPCRALQATKLHDEALPRLRERFQKLGYGAKAQSTGDSNDLKNWPVIDVQVFISWRRACSLKMLEIYGPAPEICDISKRMFLGCSLGRVFFSDIMIDRAFFRRAMHNFVAC